MRTRQEGAGSLPGKTCVIVKIATTGCDRAEDELLELTLLDARTRLDTPVMAPPLYFGRFRPFRHRDWPEARARNGLAPSDVRDAPAPDDPRERGRIQRELDGTGVLAGFNLPFTLAFLARSFRLPPSLRCLDILEDWSRYAAGTGPDSRPMWLGMGDLFRTVRVWGLSGGRKTGLRHPGTRSAMRPGCSLQRGGSESAVCVFPCVRFRISYRAGRGPPRFYRAAGTRFLSRKRRSGFLKEGPCFRKAALFP